MSSSAASPRRRRSSPRRSAAAEASDRRDINKVASPPRRSEQSPHGGERAAAGSTRRGSRRESPARQPKPSAVATVAAAVAAAAAVSPDTPPLSPNPAQPNDRYVTIAGMRHVHHRRLFAWIERESAFIGRLQGAARPQLLLLASYFGVLGTHTAFLVGLPIVAWLGHRDAVIDLVVLLASGVYFTGCVKDMLCLPRPFSPPVMRFSTSKSTCLEYGFPSTHTANATSLAFVAAFHIRRAILPAHYWIVDLSCALYAASVGLSRLLTGMHTALDIVVGGGIGTLLVGIYYDGGVRNLLFHSIYNTEGYPWIAALLAWLAISLHPDPVGPCPCFDDSVAFVSVVTGVWWGAWVCNTTGFDSPPPASYVALAVRIVAGVASLVAFRLAVKTVCYTVLPPLLSASRIPFGRRFFRVVGRDYTRIPSIGSYFPSALHFPQQNSERINIPRYDVDIITKFVVYCGIGFLAVCALPVLFAVFHI